MTDGIDRPFFRLLRRLGLTEFYVSLAPLEKRLLAVHTRNMWGGPASSRARGLFAVRDAMQFLRIAGSNALPAGHYAFAEKVLMASLQFVGDPIDLAWAHLNLAQLYLDTGGPSSLDRCELHLREVMLSGYFERWAGILWSQVQERKLSPSTRDGPGPS